MTKFCKIFLYYLITAKSNISKALISTNLASSPVMLYLARLFNIIIIIIIIELIHSKTILENTVGIEIQPVALDFKNLSQYSTCSK